MARLLAVTVRGYDALSADLLPFAETWCACQLVDVLHCNAALSARSDSACVLLVAKRCVARAARVREKGGVDVKYRMQEAGAR